MRVLMLNNEFPPLGGGTATVNLMLFTVFAREANLEIDLVTATQGSTTETERFSERIVLHRLPLGIRDLHHASNGELVRYAARALPYAWRLHRQRPYDVCMAWHTVPAGVVALCMRGLTGLPFVIRIGGADIPGFERRYARLYPFLSPVLKLTWRAAAAVVAKAHGEVEMLQRTAPWLAVTTIPNGVDPRLFQPRGAGAGGGPLRMVCVARLIERKGQKALIRAVRQLTTEGHEVALELVGGGDDRAACESLACALGVSDRVRFAGAVSREQVAQHYSSADLFVLASYNEGMSVSLLEAMASGLPVVVTRTPGTGELVREGVNGFSVPWGDDGALVTAMRRFCEDRSLAGRLGAASRECALAFGWDAAAARYMELFSSCGPRRRSGDRSPGKPGCSGQSA